MDGSEVQVGCLGNFSKLKGWIIEHIWVYKMMDLQEVVDSSSWPNLDFQHLSLEDSWRLRVSSAQVYYIMKNRDMENFDRVMDFLEATHNLLPKLLAGIKHMKIMFGLKTMVIMWMLKEGKGMVDIVVKIGQYFPNKLPQYQDQCTQHEMFLMRKNHVDFKSLAQTLTIDKRRLEDYMKNEIEEQYGVHYAQKVEDRLLDYLRELETVLSGETYIDKLLKKQRPVIKEEKLLLEIITSDSLTIAKALRKLLHCDAATCHPARIYKSPESGKKGVDISLSGSSSRAFVKPGEGKPSPEVQPESFTKGDKAACDPSRNNPLLLETGDSDVRGNQTPEEDDGTGDVRRHQTPEEDDGTGDVRRHQTPEEVGTGQRVMGENCDQIEAVVSQTNIDPHKSTSSPQFCSRHQRWVKSILWGCPDECSEELLQHSEVSSSPLLFQSSSSTSSSQDLTPSVHVPCPPNQPPLQTSTHLQTEAQAHEPANPEDEISSDSPETKGKTFQKEHLPQFLSRDTVLPTTLSPVVRLVDITSFCWNTSTSKSCRASPHKFNMLSNKQGSSHRDCQANSYRQCCTPGMKNSVFVLPEMSTNLQTAPLSQDVSASSSCRPLTRKTLSTLSQTFRRRQAGTTARHAKKASPYHSKTLPKSTVISSVSNSNFLSETSKVQRDQLKLFLPSQALMLQSSLLQPYVTLTRLNIEEETIKRASGTWEDPADLDTSDEERRMEMQEDVDSSFDVNALYSSSSSNSDSEESLDCDPDYKPHIKRKRLLLEYENARMINHL